MTGEQRFGQRAGMAHTDSEDFHPRTDNVRDFHGPAISDDRGDAAQQLALVERRIFMSEGVAARGEQKAIAVTPFAHDAMSPKTPFAQAKYDLAAASIRNAMRTNGKQVARVDCRNHAAAARDKADLAETAQDLGGEINVHTRGSFKKCGNAARSQEFLRLNLH